MPGPLSTPWARTKSGQIVAGKTRLKNMGLKSRQNMTKEDWPKTVASKFEAAATINAAVSSLLQNEVLNLLNPDNSKKVEK